uniref:Uncharacterized protein n=1 Tax=Arundo donax TaxID=35708 RepID=A0A0A9BDT9_ARUDO
MHHLQWQISLGFPLSCSTGNQNCEELPRFPCDALQLRQKDTFDLLQYVFGLQGDNIRTQLKCCTVISQCSVLAQLAHWDIT